MPPAKRMTAASPQSLFHACGTLRQPPPRGTCGTHASATACSLASRFPIASCCGVATSTREVGATSAASAGCCMRRSSGGSSVGGPLIGIQTLFGGSRARGADLFAHLARLVWAGCCCCCCVGSGGRPVCCCCCCRCESSWIRTSVAGRSVREVSRGRHPHCKARMRPCHKDAADMVPDRVAGPRAPALSTAWASCSPSQP